jgi:hypothetical protein
LITSILTLADELKGGTIETVLAKSDFEVGLEFLLGSASHRRCLPSAGLGTYDITIGHLIAYNPESTVVPVGGGRGAELAESQAISHILQVRATPHFQCFPAFPHRTRPHCRRLAADSVV